MKESGNTEALRNVSFRLEAKEAEKKQRDFSEGIQRPCRDCREVPL